MDTPVPIRLSDALICGVLAMSALSFGLMFIGGVLYGRDGNLDRLIGVFVILLGGTTYGGTWLWLFGWL